MRTKTITAVSVVSEIVKTDKNLIAPVLGVRDEGVGVCVIMSLHENSDSLVQRLEERGFVWVSTDHEDMMIGQVAMHFRKPQEFLNGDETYTRKGKIELVRVESSPVRLVTPQ